MGLITMAMLLICYMLINAMEKNRANWKTKVNKVKLGLINAEDNHA